MFFVSILFFLFPLLFDCDLYSNNSNADSSPAIAAFANSCNSLKNNLCYLIDLKINNNKIDLLFFL